MASMAVAPACPPINCETSVKMEHLSHSAISTYANCPRKFYYRYIEHAPEEFIPGALALGTAFHHAVEHIHQARIEGATIPDVSELLQHYDRAWGEATALKPLVSYAKGEDALSLREIAERMLNAYREHVVASTESNSGAQIIAIEHSERFHLIDGLPPFEMRLDLVEIKDGDLIVSDLKTSRARWNDTKLQESLPQLVLYMTGLMPFLRSLGAKRIVSRFVVITKGKQPLIQMLQPPITPPDLERLQRQILDVWNGIQQHVFVQRTGWPCSQCVYKKRCLG